MNPRRWLVVLAMAASCIPRHARPMTQVSKEQAAQRLIKAMSNNAFRARLKGFGRYRGTQGLLAMEGSFTLQKDTHAINVVMHGPFGGVLQEIELVNQGSASVLFDRMPEGLEDSVLEASLSGDVLVMTLHMGGDTAVVSLERDRITGLSLWGQRFTMSDYRRVHDDLWFPFRIDYSGPDANATMRFDTVEVVGSEHEGH